MHQAATASDPTTIRPQNFEEKMVWFGLTWVYPAFFIGFLPLIAPIFGWVLSLLAVFRLWRQTDDVPAEEKVRIPIGVWVWIGGLLVLEVALVMGHLDFGLQGRVLRSTANAFLKGWFLFALWPLVGSCLRIRPQLLIRGACILCGQSLVLILVCFVMNLAKIDFPVYTSPFGAVGGITDVMLFQSYEGEFRVSLFAPWPPALGLIGAILLCVVYLESNQKWRLLGIIGAIMMTWSSGSRTGQICLLVVPALTFILSHFSRPAVQIATGIASFFGGVFGPQLYLFIKNYARSVDQQRAGSTRLRRIITSVSLYRWKTEAFLWGHGMSVPGPHITTNKPLGSHNTWAGLLYAYGLVGAIGFGFPIIWSFIEFLLKSQKSKIAQSALGIVMVLLIYMISENLDVLLYTYWPGLLMLGIAFKEKGWLEQVLEPAPTELELPINLREKESTL